MFKGGSTKTIPIDQKWKAHARLIDGWQKKDFVDLNWNSVAAIVPFGAGPWGTFSDRMLTLRPVKRAEPFTGRLELPKKINLQKQRSILQMGSVQPETAVRIKGDVELVYDLGTQNIGYYSFEMEAPEGVEIDLYSVEYITPAGTIQFPEDHRNGMTYVTKDGINTFWEFGRHPRAVRHSKSVRILRAWIGPRESMSPPKVH